MGMFKAATGISKAIFPQVLKRMKKLENVIITVCLAGRECLKQYSCRYYRKKIVLSGLEECLDRARRRHVPVAMHSLKNVYEVRCLLKAIAPFKLCNMLALVNRAILSYT
jgi:hypothetical protein